MQTFDQLDYEMNNHQPKHEHCNYLQVSQGMFVEHILESIIFKTVIIIYVNFTSTSIPNNTTLFRLLSVFRNSLTSGIIMENTVLENTVALDTSMSLTVLPRPAISPQMNYLLII